MTRSSVLLLALSIVLLACGDRIRARQELRFAGDQLRMVLPGDWERVDLGDPEAAAFTHRGLPGVSLVLEDEGFEWEGPPMPVTGLRSMFGKELNHAYGRVTSRITFKNCALNSYPRRLEVDGRTYDSQNWVLSRMTYGDRYIARVAFSLRVPEGQMARDEVVVLVEALDEAIGDAIIDDPQGVGRKRAH